MRHAALILGLAVLLQLPSALAADTVPTRMDNARAAYGRGDLARAATELEAVVGELHSRLGRSLAEFMPPPLAGWQAENAETQPLVTISGGLAVTRAYARDDNTLNAALIIDSPAVMAAGAQFNAEPQPNIRKIKIGSEDAMMRWDPSGRSGEIVMVLGARVLLQIEGDNLANADPLTEAAKGWNLGAIRKLLGN